MIVIEGLKEWVKSIVLIVLFANFIEMLLPNSKFRGYIRVVIGFFVILVIMVPIINLLNFKTEGLNFSLVDNNQASLDKILIAGNNLRNQEEKEARGKYKTRLVKQMEAVIKLNSKFEEVQVEINLSSDNQVQKVIVDTSLTEVTPVQVDINKTKDIKERSQKQRGYLKQLLLNLYGLNEQQIEIK